MPIMVEVLPSEPFTARIPLEMVVVPVQVLVKVLAREESILFLRHCVLRKLFQHFFFSSYSNISYITINIINSIIIMSYLKYIY